MPSHRRLIADSRRRRLSEPPKAAKFFSHLWHLGALSVTATVTHLRDGPYWSHERAGETMRVLRRFTRCIEPQHAALLCGVVPSGCQPRAAACTSGAAGERSSRPGRRAPASPSSPSAGAPRSCAPAAGTGPPDYPAIRAARGSSREATAGAGAADRRDAEPERSDQRAARRSAQSARRRPLYR